MGHPDGAHTHGGGGNGLPEVVLVVLAVAVVATVVEPVLAAVAELLHVLMIAAGVIVGRGVAAVAGLACVAVAQLAGKRGPHHARFSRRWFGPLRRSHRHRERANCPPNPSVNYLAAFIFTSTGVKAEVIAAILVRERCGIEGEPAEPSAYPVTERGSPRPPRWGMSGRCDSVATPDKVGRPDGQVPTVGGHDSHRRESCSCYTPARRAQRPFLPYRAGTHTGRLGLGLALIG